MSLQATLIAELSKVELGTYTIKRTLRQILHPTYTEEDNSHVKQRISVEVEGEHRGGVPHGLCYFRFHGEGKYKAFRGIGVMSEGELHGGPALIIEEDYMCSSFAYMHHGLANGQGKTFVDLTNEKEDPDDKVIQRNLQRKKDGV
jgi:hypothetical protein